jgi:hypothetical protein
VICPECSRKGLRSVVTIGELSITLMAVHDFYDEDGKRHHHDMNTRTTRYSCSNGHHWTEQRRTPCWCGWGKS